MSIWKVLLIWLAALAATGCIGFLLATVLATIREGDEQIAKRRPPSPPKPPRHWVWMLVAAITISSYGTTLQSWLFWPYVIALSSGTVFILIRGFILGWRTQRDAHFCAKAAAACAVIAASSGFALWRFN